MSFADQQSELLLRELAAERERSQRFFGTYSTQLNSLEEALSDQLGALADQVKRRLENEQQFATEELSRARERIKSRIEQLEAETEELEATKTRLRVQRRRLAEHFRRQHDKLRRQRRGPHESAELEALATERDELAQRLSDASEQLERRLPEPSDADQEVTELRQRLERALGEVRDLKRRNNDLEQQAFDHGRASDGGSLDWESQKRRLLASLENDQRAADAERQQELLTIEGTIRITDEVVASKEREIEELKKQLAEHRHGKKAATAINEMLDRDELIQQERARLVQLERELQEKLRVAEIDLAVDRAKIARERAELDELRESMARSTDANEAVIAPVNDAKASGRGRWLTRLGLKEGEG
jgi:chromosome segregation ATPase